jgi:O-antigen ligase
MPPSLALLACFLLVAVLMRWSKDSKDSPALWLPVIWLFIISSKMPSTWFGISSTATSAAVASEEGNSFDRTVYLVLLALALWVLARRQINWSELFARNWILVSFLVFALVSLAWSDFPYISFKRWIRDLNLYAMAIIVLSDPRPRMAISAVIRRLCYILLPLSFLLIKYYPGMGIAFSTFNGSPEYVGAASGKNNLGLICMLASLFFFWDTLGRWPERKSRTARRILVANIASLLIAWRLFMFFDSATSRGCLIVGCVIILVVRSKLAGANPSLVTVGIPVAIFAYLLLASLFDLSGTVARLLGRDPTMTGRTETWKVLQQMQTNPLIGLGYGSLWTGNRLRDILTTLNAIYLNESHNGYLEIYMQLGFVGVALIVLFLLSGFRKISKHVVVSPHYAAFAVSFWVVAVLYNVTETAIGGSLVWCVLLFFTIVVPPAGHMLQQESDFPVRTRTMATLEPRILLHRSAITKERLEL